MWVGLVARLGDDLVLQLSPVLIGPIVNVPFIFCPGIFAGAECVFQGLQFGVFFADALVQRVNLGAQFSKAALISG